VASRVGTSMKIAVWHNLPSGGGKRALYDQVRGLVARGHEVEAWCPPTADLSYLPLSEIVTEHVVPLKPERDWNVDSASLGIVGRLRWNSLARLRAMERHSRTCAHEINSRSFDILFTASCTFFRTPPIARFIEIPSVLYLQEPNRLLYEAQPELPWAAMSWTGKDLMDGQFWRRALIRTKRLVVARVLVREERRNALAFDQILVNSFYSRESVLRALGIDSKVCYLGLDVDKFVSLNKERESFAVSVGAVVPAKNLDFLIEALGKVSVELRPKLFVIANIVDRAYLKRVQQLAEQTEVAFELKYRINDSEIVDLLSRAGMMLYAPRLEPFGYAPLEAGACGLPVIAVAEGGVRETIQDGVNGILVEHDAESMAAAIERLVLDDELHSRLSVQAQTLVRTVWSLGPSIDRLESRLRAVLSKVGLKSSPIGESTDPNQNESGSATIPAEMQH